MIFQLRIAICYFEDIDQNTYDSEHITLKKNISLEFKPAISEKICIGVEIHTIKEIIHDLYMQETIIDLIPINAYSKKDFEYKCKQFKEEGFE